MTPWILVSIAVLLALLVIVAVVVRKKGWRGACCGKDSYKTFFIIGVSWLPIGIALDNYAFVVMGTVFLVIGLINRDKWEDDPAWHKLSKEQRNTKLFLIIALGIGVLAALTAFFFSRYH